MRFTDTLGNGSNAVHFTKLELKGGKDPYEDIVMKDWSTVLDSFPLFTYTDIMCHLVNGKSAYSLEQMKAFKLL